MLLLCLVALKKLSKKLGRIGTTCMTRGQLPYCQNYSYLSVLSSEPALSTYTSSYLNPQLQMVTGLVSDALVIFHGSQDRFISRERRPPQNSCYHLNASALRQLPADSPRAWKLHACIESTVAADWVSMHSSGHKDMAPPKMSALSRKIHDCLLWS